MDKKIDITNKRIIIYISITFVLTYCYAIFGLTYVLNKLQNQIYASLIVSSIMFIPAISSLLTRFITKEGFHNIWILHNIKGNIRYYLFAWFGPFLLSLIGCILYYLIFNNYYDSNFSYLSSIYEASGISLSSTQLLPIIISQLIMSALFAPLLNFVNCFGEELGWRGYLLPKMLEKHKLAPTLVINGIIWGLWHAPLTVIIGHNYGFGYFGYPFTGILAMCIFCIVIGIIFSYITVKTKSCLPATFAHASLNGIASVGFLFASSQEAIKPFIGPAPTGIIGGSAFIITSIIIFYVWNKEQKGLPK